MNVDPILERMHVPLAFATAEIAACEDIFNGDPASQVIVMREWGLCVFTVVKLAGAVGTATLTVESCDTIVPGTATAVAFRYRAMTTNDTFGAWTEATTAGFSTTAGADQVYQVAIQANELVDGDIGVRLQCTEVADGGVDGCITCMLFNPKYPKSIPNTVLA